MLNDENHHLARELDSRGSLEDEVGRLTLELESTRMELAVRCSPANLFGCCSTGHGVYCFGSEILFHWRVSGLALFFPFRIMVFCRTESAPTPQ